MVIEEETVDLKYITRNNVYKENVTSEQKQLISTLPFYGLIDGTFSSN